MRRSAVAHRNSRFGNARTWARSCEVPDARHPKGALRLMGTVAGCRHSSQRSCQLRRRSARPARQLRARRAGKLVAAQLGVPRTVSLVTTVSQLQRHRRIPTGTARDRHRWSGRTAATVGNMVGHPDADCESVAKASQVRFESCTCHHQVRAVLIAGHVFEWARWRVDVPAFEGRRRPRWGRNLRSSKTLSATSAGSTIDLGST